jgi:hypothetical protein
MPNLKFTDIFPEYKHLRHWDYYQTPEYTVYRYLLDDKIDLIDRLEKIKILLNAPNTFYARDVFKGVATGGIMNGLCHNCIITETGNKQKYYIDDPYGKTAIIGYSKEWKLSMSKEQLMVAYQRIRMAILAII